MSIKTLLEALVPNLHSPTIHQTALKSKRIFSTLSNTTLRPRKANLSNNSRRYLRISSNPNSKMPFFSRYHTPTSAFPTDVFRVFDELNQLTSPTANPSQGGNKRAFSPNFDIHETDSTFVLEGELPGIENKSQINIEFTDGNTLLIHGKIEKSYKKSSPDTDSKAAENSTPTAESEATDGKAADDKATDDKAIDGKAAENQVAQRPDDSQKAVGKPTEGYRYWVSERTVGEFHRSFSFPGAIDIDAVKATLENGILKIVVPKKEVAKGKRIEIA